MKLDANITLSDLSPAKLLRALQRYRSAVITVVIAALLGYTGYQLAKVSDVTPDQAYLKTAQQSQKVPNLKGNRRTLTELQSLQPSGDTTIVIPPGKQNPFSLK